MIDRQYTEPSNEQLAKFIVVYLAHIPGLAALPLTPDAYILERQFELSSHLREAALVHHRRFQDQIFELTEKMNTGELQCEHIRPNGKRCPNYNEPGHMYCGLHKAEGE